MPYNDKLKTVFLHIPKTGGSAVRRLLGIRRFHSHDPTIIPSPQHLTCARLRLVLGEQKYDSYFKFTFVRNPWSRLVSEYHWRQAGPRRRVDLSFPEFVEFVADAVREERYYSEPFGDHFIPQVRYTSDVDRVFRFESFERDLLSVANLLGVDLATIPDKPVRPWEPWWRHYDDRTRALVESIYGEDIEAFGYRFTDRTARDRVERPSARSNQLLQKVREAGRFGESSARAVLEYFQSQGVARDEITGSHLEPLFRGLRTIPQTAGKLCQEPLGLKPASEPCDAPVCGVIVETRKHPALEFVVRSFAEQLEIPIQLYHGVRNERFILNSGLQELIHQGRLQLRRMDVAKLRSSLYNALFLSQEFWESMAGRRQILVFQCDALVCRESPFSLTDFRAFDYIGASRPSGSPTGLRIHGGCGGLSLRDWNWSVRSLQTFAPELWPGGEDGYFAFHLDLMGAKVAQPEDCARFASQHSFLYQSFGVHKPRLMGKETLRHFEAYCPDVRRIL